MNPNNNLASADFYNLLKPLGFHPDSFLHLNADEMPWEMLQQTFVEHPQYKEYVLDSDNSAVLLAPSGGGKTANRRLLELTLRRHQRNVNQHGSQLPKVPFVITYNNFETLASLTQPIGLQDHYKPLVKVIVDEFLNFINSYPTQFMQIDQRERDWWWGLLELDRGQSVYHSLKADSLIGDWQRNGQKIPPFSSDNPLIDTLNKIQYRLANIGFNKLYILVDGIDGVVEPTSISNMEALVKPLLNTDELFSRSGRIWKFFLPDSLLTILQRSRAYSSKRLRVLQIQWLEKDKKHQVKTLVEFLKLRLGWESNRQEQHIQPLCENDLETELKLQDNTIEESLALLALRHKEQGPPRALLTLVEKLLRISIRQGKSTITLQDWKNFVALIEQDLKDARFVRSMLFSINSSQRKQLIDLLIKLPNISSYQGRTSLLAGIPGIQNLTRDENNAQTDLEIIIEQLNRLGPTSLGDWPIVTLIENAITYVTGYVIEKELHLIKDELIRIYEG